MFDLCRRLQRDQSRGQYGAKDPVCHRRLQRPGIDLIGRQSGFPYRRRPFIHDPGATAIDNIDGTITGKIDTTPETINTSVVGTDTVTYSVSDRAGNKATAQRIVVIYRPLVKDTIAPVITLKGANPMTIALNSTYTEPGATAIDNVDGDISNKIIISGTVNTSVANTYTIYYNVSDNAGNAAVTKTRTVVVTNYISSDSSLIITLGDQSKEIGFSFDTLLLDTCATDSLYASTTLNWTIKNGKYFLADSIIECPVCTHFPCQVCITPAFHRRIAIVPDTTKINPATWTGSDTLYLTVKDPGGLSKTKPIVFAKWSLIIRPLIGYKTIAVKEKTTQYLSNQK